MKRNTDRQLHRKRGKWGEQEQRRGVKGTDHMIVGAKLVVTLEDLKMKGRKKGRRKRKKSEDTYL